MLFIPTFSQRLKRLPFSPRQVFNQKGQSIIILAFAFLGLIAMLGLALDLGLVYIERTRIKRAVDAATLAAVVELPNEENAYLRAIAYLDENGYQLWDGAGNPQANIWVRGCAHDRYFSTNNFDNYHDGTTVDAGMFTTTYGPDDDVYFLYFPPAGGPLADPRADFYINTRTFQSYDTANAQFYPDGEQCNAGADVFGTANKINVSGVIPVNMNFMQFFGFAEVPVADAAIAQNVTSLDVAVVFDMSGSMQFDTSGLGFYEPYLDGTQRWYNIDNGTQYPNPALINRIPIDHLPRRDLSGSLIGDGARNAGQMCWQRDGNTVDYFTVGGGGDPRRYVVMEAELYSLNTSLLAGPYRQPGRGYWSVQNTDRRIVDRMMYGGSNYTGARPILDNDPDYQGSWVTHNPFVTWSIEDQVPFGHRYTLDEVRTDPNSVPSVEYDFVTADDWDGTGNDDTRIWMRAQGGYYWWAEGDGPHDIFWAVYEYTDLYGVHNGNPVGSTPLGTGNIERTAQEPGNGTAYGGAQSNSWSWNRLNNTGLDLDNGTRYTLKIWAGQSGLDIDQIVVGNQNNTAFTSNYSSGATNLDATPGSAFRQACNRCNPIYGLTVDQADCSPPNDNGANSVPQDGYDLSLPDNNALYSGYQPIRGAKEAVKRFISQMNPRFDQAGIVAYSTYTPDQGRVELRCLKKEGSDCYSGANPISYTEVLETIERLPPNGSTNIAQGMLRGLEMLGINADNVGSYNPSLCNTDTAHCSRGGAARRILIIMSDGVANRNPRDTSSANGGSSVRCYPTTTDRTLDLYQPNIGDESKGADSEDRAKDCVMYYGKIAADNNVTIYTIGLGNGVDVKMMTDVAELTGSGEYFAALSPAQLDGIFDTILKSVSVRLVE